MSATIKVLVPPQFLPDTNTVLYTVPAGARTLIFQATATCISGNKTIDIYLVPSGGSASTSNIELSARPIGNNDTYLCPELVGHVLNAGDQIVGKANAASSVNIRVTGREIV